MRTNDIPPASESRLQTVDVVKRYFDGTARVHAVDGVSIDVPGGAFWVLQGPSGSGKTTLLGLLGGLITPTRGDVRIAGKSVVHMRDHHRTRWRRAHVGVVFQDFALIPGMSLMENVLLPLVPTGGAQRDDIARAEALLERLGLTAKRAVRIERLSGGQRQRGALARALIAEPDVLLLDEPTAHVDAENAARMLEHLVALRDRGTTVVASTHDPRLADDPRVDHVSNMRAGKLVDLEDAGNSESGESAEQTRMQPAESE